MNNSDQKNLKEDLVLLISYLVTSARGLVDEPKSYGPLRVIEVTSRLIALMHKYGMSDGILDAIAKEIDEGKFLRRTEMELFKDMLDSVVLKTLEMVNSIFK